MARAMVGAALHNVNQNVPRTMPCARSVTHPDCGILPGATHAADLALEQGLGWNVQYLSLIALAAALALVLVWLRQRHWQRRERAIRRLLDGADGLEAQLLECRARMQRLKSMIVVLPEEMSASANIALTADDKVNAGLRDLLAHRLWIKQRAETASAGELDTACAALDQSREVMRSQLARLDAITGELADAQSSASSFSPRNKSSAP